MAVGVKAQQQQSSAPFFSISNVIRIGLFAYFMVSGDDNGKKGGSSRKRKLLEGAAHLALLIMARMFKSAAAHVTGVIGVERLVAAGKLRPDAVRLFRRAGDKKVRIDVALDCVYVGCTVTTHVPEAYVQSLREREREREREMQGANGPHEMRRTLLCRALFVLFVLSEADKFKEQHDVCARTHTFFCPSDCDALSHLFVSIDRYSPMNVDSAHKMACTCVHTHRHFCRLQAQSRVAYSLATSDSRDT